MDAIVKKAQKYFKGRENDFIWATEDGHFFWDEMFASNYARKNKKKLVKVVRKDHLVEAPVEGPKATIEEPVETPVVKEGDKKEKNSKPKRARK